MTPSLLRWSPAEDAAVRAGAVAGRLRAVARELGRTYAATRQRSSRLRRRTSGPQPAAAAPAPAPAARLFGAPWSPPKARPWPRDWNPAHVGRALDGLRAAVRQAPLSDDRRRLAREHVETLHDAVWPAAQPVRADATAVDLATLLRRQAIRYLGASPAPAPRDAMKLHGLSVRLAGIERAAGHADVRIAEDCARAAAAAINVAARDGLAAGRAALTERLQATPWRRAALRPADPETALLRRAVVRHLGRALDPADAVQVGEIIAEIIDLQGVAVRDDLPIAAEVLAAAAAAIDVAAAHGASAGRGALTARLQSA